MAFTSKETQIKLLKGRIALLTARGPHNAKIIAKLKRQLRALENNQ